MIFENRFWFVWNVLWGEKIFIFFPLLQSDSTAILFGKSSRPRSLSLSHFQTNKSRQFLSNPKKITWWSSIVFFGLSVLPHHTCVTHTPSPKEIYPRKYRQIFLPYSCSNGGAWVKDIYPRKYCQIFTNLFFNAYLDTLCLSFPLHWSYMLYNSYPPHKVSWFAIYYKLID